ncbi:MAG: hypothetical protein V1853_03485 [bacterium]
MDKETNIKLERIEKSLIELKTSAERSRKLFIWVAIIGLILFMLILIAILMLLPLIIQSLDLG